MHKKQNTRGNATWNAYLGRCSGWRIGFEKLNIGFWQFKFSKCPVGKLCLKVLLITNKFAEESDLKAHPCTELQRSEHFTGEKSGTDWTGGHFVIPTEHRHATCQTTCFCKRITKVSIVFRSEANSKIYSNFPRFLHRQPFANAMTQSFWRRRPSLRARRRKQIIICTTTTSRMQHRGSTVAGGCQRCCPTPHRLISLIGDFWPEKLACTPVKVWSSPELKPGPRVTRKLAERTAIVGWLLMKIWLGLNI